eukprot:1918531-Amphidinium_carterae.1
MWQQDKPLKCARALTRCLAHKKPLKCDTSTRLEVVLRSFSGILSIGPALSLEMIGGCAS